MNLAQYSLDNTKIVYFFLAVLLIGGILSFGRLGKKEDAPFVIKSAVIMTCLLYTSFSAYRLHMLCRVQTSAVSFPLWVQTRII